MDKHSYEDRRRFFRIDDAVNLYFKIVDEKTVIAASEVSDDVLGNCSLNTAIEVLDQEGRLVMNRVEKRDPEIAEYLKLMDSKINLLAQTVMHSGNEFTESNLCNTNLSASGLAIEIEQQIAEGAFLEIKLFLSSCVAVIVIYGKVIYCKENTLVNATKPYQVGIDYINLREQDREVLIKHIIKRQMQQIRDDQKK